MLMKMSINNTLNKMLIFCALSLLVSACQNPEQAKSEHQMYVFGTLVSITTWHQDRQQTTQAIDAISELFNAMHHQWHAWKPGRLSDINQQLAKGQAVELTDEELAFLQQTIQLAEQSGQRFNPVIGALINLWGFHTDDYPLLTAPPDKQAIDELVSLQLDTAQLHLDDHRLTAGSDRVWLDFGAIAKGYAVDRAIELLRQHGIENAIVNAGGDLRSIGSKGDQPWRIAIQSPADWQPVAQLTVAGDEAIFTSGNYQRYKEFDGQRFSHIINPLDGMPVGEVVSATVVAERGIRADAAATALVVAGSNDWPAVAKAMGISQALVIDDQHNCRATQAMLDRLVELTVDCSSVDQVYR
jgi:thiamine biosynthesis lipoprotein